jgi:hypothetical protein
MSNNKFNKIKAKLLDVAAKAKESSEGNLNDPQPSKSSLFLVAKAALAASKLKKQQDEQPVKDTKNVERENQVKEEAPDFSKLMAKNISDAFQMPVKETFSKIVNQAANIPNFFSAWEATEEVKKTQIEDTDAPESTKKFRKEAIGSMDVKTFIKLDYFKVDPFTIKLLDKVKFCAFR